MMDRTAALVQPEQATGRREECLELREVAPGLPADKKGGRRAGVFAGLETRKG